MSSFKLEAPFKPTGNQPQAIEKLVDGFSDGLQHQTLLGVTGSGKTFTMANVIEAYSKPTLVISHNKTLAAQFQMTDHLVEHLVMTGCFKIQNSADG